MKEKFCHGDNFNECNKAKAVLIVTYKMDIPIRKFALSNDNLIW